MFRHHRIPDVLVTDNGPKYASAKFARFAAGCQDTLRVMAEQKMQWKLWSYGAGRWCDI